MHDWFLLFLHFFLFVFKDIEIYLTFTLFSDDLSRSSENAIDALITLNLSPSSVYDLLLCQFIWISKRLFRF